MELHLYLHLTCTRWLCREGVAYIMHAERTSRAPGSRDEASMYLIRSPLSVTPTDD